MRINMRSAAAKRLLAELYEGESLPLSIAMPTDRPLSLEWWKSNPQGEGSGSARHAAALALYLRVSKASKISLRENSFPALMDFDDQAMRPDKGVMKVFIDEGLVEPRLMGAQLVFDVTPAGREYLALRGLDKI